MLAGLIIVSMVGAFAVVLLISQSIWQAIAIYAVVGIVVLFCLAILMVFKDRLFPKDKLRY